MKVHLNQHIWIIDDDPSVRQALARLLRSQGYSVETFSSAAGISRGRDLANVSCLLLDIYLPEESGVDIHDRVRKTGFSSPVIFITAKTTGHLAQRAKKRAPLLSKPFDSATVLNAINQAVSSPLPSS